MIKICDANQLNCQQYNRMVQMKVAVNFNGKLNSYCCEQCANDDIGECSEGADNIERAKMDGDVFVLPQVNN